MFRFFQLIYFKIRQKFLQGKVIRNSEVDKSATIQSGSQFVNSRMGRHSYAAYDCLICDCEIGNFCSIAQGVVIGAAEHPIERVSTSPAFEGITNSSPRARFADFPAPEAKRTIIGSDVWIGANAIIKGGVKIGHGAVIGAGAVVTKDVAPYAIAVGCPAKFIRYRFDESIRHRLLLSKWWELPDHSIKTMADKISSPADFLEALQLNGFIPAIEA